MYVKEEVRVRNEKRQNKMFKKKGEKGNMEMLYERSIYVRTIQILFAQVVRYLCKENIKQFLRIISSCVGEIQVFIFHSSFK